ncbi:MAG: ABC transporter ATP-binding protein [Verrucomicrobiales bacterium]
MNQPAAQSVFQFVNVAKRYQMGEETVHALRDACLEVRRGDFLAVLGPSGSGKSTLMHIMGMMDQPTAGRVTFDGEDVTRARPSRRATLRREKIGFVFQAFNLLPRLSVLENVLVPLLYQRIHGKQAHTAAHAVLETVGLADRIKHMPTQLSGGQRQRVAIARALVNNPRVILADEPTGNLDSTSAARVLDVFTRLHEQGRTVVLVTHDPKVAGHARRRVLVEDGRVSEEAELATRA